MSKKEKESDSQQEEMMSDKLMGDDAHGTPTVDAFISV